VYIPFKYPSEWTENWESYQNNKENLIAYIRDLMYSYPQGIDSSTATDIQQQLAILDMYVKATPLFKALIN
jgi:hypothetical protein